MIEFSSSCIIYIYINNKQMRLNNHFKKYLMNQKYSNTEQQSSIWDKIKIHMIIVSSILKKI